MRCAKSPRSGSAHGELAPGARRLARRRASGRHSGRAEVPGVPEELARLLAEEKEEGTEDGDRKVKEDWGDVDEEAW